MAAERAAAAPFESLIEDAPAPAPARAPEPRAVKSQRAADDHSPRTERARSRQDAAPPVKSGNKAHDTAAGPAEAAAKSADAAKAADAKTPDKEAPAEAGTAVAEAPGKEAPAEVKTTEVAAQDAPQLTGDDAKVDDKIDDAADGTTADIDTDAVAVPVPAQTPVPAAAAIAIAAAVAFAPAATTDTAPATDEPIAINAEAAKSAPQAVLAALELKAGKKTDDAKPAATTAATADSKAAVKSDTESAAPFDPEATAPSVHSEASKQAAASARGEADAEKPGQTKPDASAVTADKTNAAAPKQAPDIIVQPTAQTAPAHGAGIVAAHAATTAAAAAAVAAAPTVTKSPEPAVPLSGVAVEIANKALNGKNQFDIRLDPPDLGRIHVRLEVDKDGNVISHLVADRTDTLDMLRRDSAGLDRALQDAGLKTSGDSLQFSLRDQGADQQQDRSGGNTAHLIVEDESAVSIEATARDYARYGARAGGLDIRV